MCGWNRNEKEVRSVRIRYGKGMFDCFCRKIRVIVICYSKITTPPVICCHVTIRSLCNTGLLGDRSDIRRGEFSLSTRFILKYSYMIGRVFCKLPLLLMFSYTLAVFSSLSRIRGNDDTRYSR